MHIWKTSIVTLTSLLLILSSCSSMKPVDQSDRPEASLKASIIGTWITSDETGISEITYTPDGNAEITGLYRLQDGKKKAEAKATWHIENRKLVTTFSESTAP